MHQFSVPNRRQAAVVLTIFALLVSADQVSKAWAWRHAMQVRVHVNSGGDMLVGPVVSSWYRSRTIGAAFDVLDATLLLGLGMLLIRRRRSRATLVAGSLALAGWASNLADRLVLHFWTAPGSIRGVVDFLPWDGRYWNVADLAIIAGTSAFVLALTRDGLRGLVAPRRRRRQRAARRPLIGRRARSGLGLGLAGSAVLAAIGAIAYSGVSAPAIFATAGG